jgi:hypothetical protein
MKQDDSAERLLAALSKAEPSYLEDGGFTERVIARLPPRRRSRVRTPLILGSALLGIALVWVLPATAWLERATTSLATRQVPTVSLVTALCAMLGVILWGSLVAATE